jgi:hypothetical protein
MLPCSSYERFYLRIKIERHVTCYIVWEGNLIPRPRRDYECLAYLCLAYLCLAYLCLAYLYLTFVHYCFSYSYFSYYVLSSY